MKTALIEVQALPADGSNTAMARKVTTHLMFEGAAEEAMTLYVSLFGDSRIETIERYGPGEMGAEGSVKLAHFSLAGRSSSASTAR